MFSSRIQYYNGKIYTDLYTYEGADSKFLLSEVNMKDGKRTSFWLDAVQYNKAGMNCSLQTNNLLFLNMKVSLGLVSYLWIQYCHN